jgi:excisionase family DNA binding protein
MTATTELGRRAFGIRTVANAFEVSTDSVKRWVRDELVRSIRVGGRRLIPLSEVERIEREGIPRRKAR